MKGGNELISGYQIDYRRSPAERKEARFWQRFFTGAELADRLRFLTLNSSDESVVLGYDIMDSFSKLVKRIRRKYGVFEYFGVVEYDREVVERRHLHIINKGVYMPQVEIELMWIETHRSIKPYIKKVESVGGAAGYLAKYLDKERGTRYFMSAGWIFGGYVGWTKAFKRVLGYYPSSELVKYMASMTAEERRRIIRGGYDIEADN